MKGDIRDRLQGVLGPGFAVERELGGGGMSRVFVAEEIALGRRIVVKVLPPELAEGLSAERFTREMQLAARLQHPHIVPLLSTGAVGLVYYTMPYVQGESVADRLVREGQLPIDAAVRIARETAQALHYAHEQGVVHRDIKPANILLSDGHAMITDFGIARAIGSAAGDWITATGISVGTPTYMSPEQAAGERADARSDVYSLGCVLYEMLAGEPPFTGPTAQAVIAKRMSSPPPRVSVVRGTVPAALEAALLTALATSPTDRFQSAAALARALDDAALSGAAPTSAVERAARRGGRPRRWHVVVVGIAAAAAIAVAASLTETRHEPSVSSSADRLAVFPFTVHGGGAYAASLGDGMADLLSRNLDGLQQIRAVDPNTVITRTHRAIGDAELPAARARALSRELGAGQYVAGTVTMIGDRLRIQASLFAPRGDSARSPAAASDSGAVASASVEGDTTQLFALVDRLATDLVARRYRGPGSRLAETAASTTTSLPALRSYLDAESHLRNARFDKASAGYESAIAADSGFALAHYRLAVALGLHGDWWRAAPIAERALTLSQRLSARDRRLVEAYAAFVRGQADSAERRYRAILAEYPDDLEARFLLGRTLFYYNPSRGREVAEASPVFDAVLAADPEFLCPI